MAAIAAHKWFHHCNHSIKKTKGDKNTMKKLLRTSSTLLSLACAGVFLGQASMALAASSGNSQALATEAAKEGSVTFYSVLPIPEDQSAIKLFNKQYPDIKVLLIREGTGLLDNRYAAEARANATAADLIVQPSGSFLKQAKDMTWGVDLTPGAFPALKAWPMTKVYGQYAEIMVVPWGIEYNTNQVASPPSYQDLLKPEYNGKLILTSPLNGSPESGAWKYMSDEFGALYLKQLAGQNPTFVESVVSAVQGVASGQFAATIFSQPGVDSALLAKGAPVKFVLPSHTGGFAQYLMVSAKAPHPAAARLFANFLFTREGQQAFVGGNGISPLGDIPGAVQAPSNLKIENLTESAKRAQDYANLLGERP